jgi:hypothetical protein
MSGVRWQGNWLVRNKDDWAGGMVQPTDDGRWTAFALGGDGLKYFDTETEARKHVEDSVR